MALLRALLAISPSSLIFAGTAFASSAQIPPLPPLLPDAVPAFPGAWGGGMFTQGGRGGRVLAVTNLNDNGPGSLRAALEASGPRTVIFRVAGRIDLQSNLAINEPFITIAGQSAPGDGICLANHSLNINTHQVIVRHLRVRRGDPKGGQGSDNIGGNPGDHVIIDHCSVSWGRDENISLYRHMEPAPDGAPAVKQPARFLTIQWTISSEALGPGHEFGGTWGGQPATFHHNLFACNTGRNPSIGMSEDFDYRNNVIFNWGHRSMDGGDETSTINVISNYYKPGPATRADMRTVIARMETRNQFSPGKRRSGGWYPLQEERPGKWYVAGNIVEGHPEITTDNWRGMVGPAELARVATPFAGWPVAQETAAAAYESVLAQGGATLPRRDAVDQRVIAMVRSGRPDFGHGILTHPDQVGGYPHYTYTAEEVATDSDNDGLPDAWERQHELNPAKQDSASLDRDGDGYTDVEEWLNGTDPRTAVDYKNWDNNRDTISG